MWKDFFYYTKAERRGVAVLLALMAIMAAVRLALPHLLPRQEGKRLPQAYISQLHELEQQMSLHTARRPLKGKIDPLQLDSSGFVKVGFTADEAHEIMTLKRSNEPAEFYFLFMEYAMEKDIEWVEHLDDLRIRR